MLLGDRHEGFTWVRDVATGTITSTTLDGPVTDRFRRFDVGPCVGLGVNLPAGVGVSLRAYQGVVSLTQGSEEAEAGSAPANSPSCADLSITRPLVATTSISL
jgi:hypothetical protein